MVFLAANYCRCIAHDRRGHGRSTQPWNGNDMDTYADDLSELIETLDLHGATLVGHSAGGGEVARYIGRHGTKRVARAVLVSAVSPLMLQTHANPAGPPLQKFDDICALPHPGWPGFHWRRTTIRIWFQHSPSTRYMEFTASSRPTVSAVAFPDTWQHRSSGTTSNPMGLQHNGSRMRHK